MEKEEILLMQCLKKIVFLYFFSVASAVQAFDAGSSDPNLSVFDDLPGSIGCRMQATFLAPARNITELILLDFGNNVSHQYGGIYYSSQFNAWSAEETSYNLITAPDLRIGGNILTYSEADLTNLCGWSSASITDLTPITTFGNGTFADASTASMRIDFEYLNRTYIATGSITGGAGDVATITSTLLGTNAAPTALSTTRTTSTITVAFTAPVNDLPSDPDEAANAITDYEYELNGSGNWVSAGVTLSPVVISNLAEGTQYSIKLRAVNGVGAGASSNATTATTIDNTGPTMNISAAEVSDGDTSTHDSLSLTFTSSEATADFDQTDITVTNGSIGDFTPVSATVYTATFTPAAGGASTIDVSAGRFTDAAGNNNIAAAQFNWTYTYLSDPTKKPDVAASIMSEELIAYRFYNGSIQSVNGRLEWLASRRGGANKSKQGIIFKFSDPFLNQLINSSPRRLREFDQTDLRTLASNLASNPEQTENIVTAQAIALGVAELKANTREVELNPDFENTFNSWNFWTDGEISVGKSSASKLSSARDFNRSLLTFGFDNQYKQNNLIGFALSVGREDVDVGTNGSTIQSDNIGAILYTAYTSEEFPQIEASFGYSDLTFETKRIEGNAEITGERKGTVYHGSFGFRNSNTAQQQDLIYSSHARLNLGQITLKSYSETGGITALKYFDQHINYEELEAGVEISKTLRLGGVMLRPHSSLQYSHILNTSSVASMRYVSLPRQYQLNVPTEMKSGWQIGVGCDLWDHENFNANILISRSQANAETYVNSIKFGLRYSF